MRPVRIGLVGCGHVAGQHARVLAEIGEAELAAVCDLDSGRALALATEQGVPVARDLDALLGREDVEAVLLCLPAAIHAEIGLSALAAGVHVLVEKPIDLDPEAALRLVEKARESSLVLSVVSQNRFHDDVLWLKERLAAGELGRPILANAFSLWQRGQDYYDAAPGRGRHDAAEGGVLLNQAVHISDLLLWLCGPARSVQAHLATFTHEMAAEDTAQVLAELEHGLATIVASTSVCPQPPERIEIRCERGTAVLVGGRITELRRAEGEPELVPPSRREGASVPDRLEVFRRQHRDFARAVRQGGDPLVTAEQALAVIEFLRAACQSHVEGRRLPIHSSRPTAAACVSRSST